MGQSFSTEDALEDLKTAGLDHSTGKQLPRLFAITKHDKAIVNSLETRSTGKCELVGFKLDDETAVALAKKIPTSPVYELNLSHNLLGDGTIWMDVLAVAFACNLR